MGGKIPGWAGWLLGALVALVLVVLGWLWLAPREMAPEPEPVAEAPAPVEPARPEPTEQAETAEPAALPMAPRFDVVRIRPDGSAVVAGQAEPGADVAVLVDGGEIFATEADRAANFVALFTLPPAPVDRVMTLEARLADGRVLISEESVIIEPAAMVALADEEAPAEPQAPAPGEGEPEVAAAEAPEAVSEAAPEAAEPPVEMAEAAPEAPEPVRAAPRVLLAGPEGVTVLQDENPAAQLTIDSIAYDESGEVALAGRGQGEETLQIYLDNAPVHSAEVGEDGQWRAPLPDVETGVYTLRVDAVDEEGAVTSRVETPFKREEPEVLAGVAAQAEAEGRPLSSVTIQPGNTLWAIARGRYGEGLLYVKIYNANKDQIRNPDLIYPGQVFTLPENEAGTGQ